MTIPAKLRMARQLEKLGVDVIEAGFPVASDGDFQAVQAIAGEIRFSKVAALCRTRPKDIELAWEAVRKAASPRIHTFIATSEIHMRHKLKMTREQVLESISNAVEQAKRYTEDVEFSAEDSSRSDINFVVQAANAAVRAGATVVNLPDTVGYATPAEYGKMFAHVRENAETGNIVLSSHTHNDLGLAVANSLAAMQNGADQIECTINGIGERAGNASLEEIVMAIQTRPTVYGVKTKIDTTELCPTSSLLSEITGVKVQPNKAIVGDNAFAHEAGIHQDGVLKNALTYEIMTPESVGLACNRLVLGKHSGRHALGKRCMELGFRLSSEELEKTYQAIMKVADSGKEITDDEIKEVVADNEYNGRKVQMESGKQALRMTQAIPVPVVSKGC